MCIVVVHTHALCPKPLLLDIFVLYMYMYNFRIWASLHLMSNVLGVLCQACSYPTGYRKQSFSFCILPFQYSSVSAFDGFTF